MLIEPSTPVIVVAVKGSRIVVRPVLPSDLSEQPAAVIESPIIPDASESELVNDTNSAPEEPEPLDFDIPEDPGTKS